MAEPERERRETEGQGARTGPADEAKIRAQDKTGDAKAKAQEAAGHLVHGARAKGAQVAGRASGLGRKAREAATDAERATARRAATPLVVAVAAAVAVAAWVRRRRRKQRGLLRRLTKR